MSVLISFTILALDGNDNVQDTYENKVLSLKSPMSSKDFVLPSIAYFANMIGMALGFSNFTLQKTPKQYISLINTVTDIETYRQEYVFDNDYNMLSKIYREGELKLTINREDYYDENGERENNYIQDSLAEECDKILSPEFSFTKMTLREMLQQVGGFIHGEPRITNFELEKSNGKLDRINYTVAFDKYGSKEYSHIKNEEYFSTGAKKDIKNFCKKDKKFSKNPLTIIFLCFILCIQ